MVIAGSGPTGLTLAAILSRLGVRCLLLERAEGLPKHPQVCTRISVDCSTDHRSPDIV